MAKEIAISKRIKITKAQQNILLIVLGASVLLGVSVCLTVRFIRQISFNAQVIMAEDEAIVAYSDVVKNTGVCKAPSGKVYSDEEIEKCNPSSIETSEIPNTLRANILENIAASPALNSVPKEISSNCINPTTGQNYTYKELDSIYKKAVGSSELTAASQLIKSCSALRIIPDALPAFGNEEALLASLNKIFIDSGWQPESLSPSGASNSSQSTNIPAGLGSFSVNLAIGDVNTDSIMRLLTNIERSIREFNISNASITWDANNTLSFSADATAFYTSPSTVIESEETISPETGPSKTQIVDSEEGTL